MVEAALNRMQNEFNRLSIEFPAEDIITKRATMKDRMDELSKYIPEYEQRLKKLEEELQELEERARKAGVPPGWLRDVQTTPSTSKSRSTFTD
jgi:predicted nuclease with TOPRIM domain